MPTTSWRGGTATHRLGNPTPPRRIWRRSMVIMMYYIIRRTRPLQGYQSPPTSPHSKLTTYSRRRWKWRRKSAVWGWKGQGHTRICTPITSRCVWGRHTQWRRQPPPPPNQKNGWNLCSWSSSCGSMGLSLQICGGKYWSLYPRAKQIPKG